MLPPELWELIIDQLCDEPKALMACALVCSSWTDRSQRHIFSRLQIRIGFGAGWGSLPKTKQILGALGNSVRLCSYVTHIHLFPRDINYSDSPDFDYFGSFARHLTSVKRLSLHAGSLQRDLLWWPGRNPPVIAFSQNSIQSLQNWNLSAVTYLKLTDIQIPSAMFTSCLNRLPSLEILTLYDCTITKGPEPEIPLVLVNASIRKMRVLNCLGTRWLALDGCVAPLSSLRYLSLAGLTTSDATIHRLCSMSSLRYLHYDYPRNVELHHSLFGLSGVTSKLLIDWLKSGLVNANKSSLELLFLKRSEFDTIDWNSLDDALSELAKHSLKHVVFSFDDVEFACLLPKSSKSVIFYSRHGPVPWDDFHNLSRARRMYMD